MAYGKLIIRSVDLKTKSGPVLYTNLLGIWPMLLFAYLGGEPSKLHANLLKTPVPPPAFVFLAVGCIAGTAIGYR